jgi:hypothetical protein
VQPRCLSYYSFWTDKISRERREELKLDGDIDPALPRGVASLSTAFPSNTKTLRF